MNDRDFAEGWYVAEDRIPGTDVSPEHYFRRGVSLCNRRNQKHIREENPSPEPRFIYACRICTKRIENERSNPPHRMLGTITLDGRLYTLELSTNKCDSLTHGHDHPHADGSPGLPYHHHHAGRCQDFPLNAILRPVDRIADYETDRESYQALHPQGTILTPKKARP